MAAYGHPERLGGHQSSMFSSLHDRQKQGKFCDVLLTCADSGKTFNAHSCVLSSASTVLDQLLNEAMERGCVVPGTSKVMIMLPDEVDSSCMESLLNFIYSGNIDLNPQKLPAKESGSTKRKSKRNVSKGKTLEDAESAEDSRSNIDIPLLNAFLKASRHLRIQNLTEHLESAVTLFQMQMSDSREPAKDQRPSRKSQNPSKLLVTRSSDSSSNDEKGKNEGRVKKNKGNDAVTKPNVQTPQKKTRHMKSSLASDEKSDTMEAGKEIEGKKTGSKIGLFDMFAGRKRSAGMEGSNNHTRSKKNASSKDAHSKINHNTTKEVSKEIENDGKRNRSKKTTSTKNANLSSKDVSNDEDITIEMVGRGKQVKSRMARNEKSEKVGVAARKQNGPDKHPSNLDETVYPIEVTPGIEQMNTKTRNAKKKVNETSHGVQGESSEPVPKPRSKKLQRSTGKEVFKEPEPHEAHLKNNIHEIEQVSSKKSEEEAEVTFKITDQNSENANNTEKTVLSEATEVISERPKRASAARFHAMMKSTFGVGGDEQSPEKQGHLSPDTNWAEIEDVAKEETVEHNEEIVQQIVFASENVEEEVVVVEPDDEVQEWQPNSDFENIEQSGEDPETVLSVIPFETSDIIIDDHEKKKKKRKPTKLKTDQKEKVCSICGELVTNFKGHMKTHMKSLQCTICGDMFKYRSALKRHTQFHTEGLACNVCGEKLFSQREMTRHMTKHNQKKMRTECPDCKKSFTSEYVMQLHRRTHTGEEKFSCNICSKKFPYKSSLKMHMLLHTGEKPYICSICGKCFVQKIHAKEHEMQHQGIRRHFQCHICDKNFAHKCGLTRHIADIHNKSRPYVCDKCGKSFPRKTKLIEHNRMHTGEKPYICEICGVRYKANRSLKLHKKNTHGIFVPDYEVGIWRKGPLPPYPDATAKSESKKKKKFRDVKNINANKSLLSFPFPISMEEVSVSDDENSGDTAMQVDAVAEAQSGNNSPPSESDKLQQHFTYRIPQAERNFRSYDPITESSTLQEKTPLPPASTLTKSGPSKNLNYVPFGPQKTFIVPLTSAANPALPVLVDPNPNVVNDHVQMPGMMVTYMMPPLQYSSTARPVTGSSSAPGIPTTDISRSASVPPMSTFSRASKNNGSAINKSEAMSNQPLPGMHTFQPVHFQVSASGDIIEEPDIVTVNEGQSIMQVSPEEDVPAHVEEVTVQHQSDDWTTDEYSS